MQLFYFSAYRIKRRQSPLILTINLQNLYFMQLQDIIKEHEKGLNDEEITTFIDQYLMDAKNTTDPEQNFKHNSKFWVIPGAAT